MLQDKGSAKFGAIYEKYKYLMHKVAFDVLHDSYLAEDAVHEAFLKLSKHLDSIGEVESLATKRYLITVTRHAAIDIFRKRNKQMYRELFIDEIEEGEMPLSYVEPEGDNEVLNILRNLPEKYREVFLLKYSSHMENDEIAAVCGIKEATVRQRIARGKKIIEEKLNELGGD